MDPVPPSELQNVTVNGIAYFLLTELLVEPQPGSKIVTTATLSLLLGILTVFTGAAIYLLARKGLDRLSIRVQIFCTVVLCTCSWAYCALQVARNVSSENSIAYLGHNLRVPILNVDGVTNVNAIQGIDIASTAMLAINMVIGDAIVWWRACALWKGNIWVRMLCALLLLSTSALAIASVALSESAKYTNLAAYFQNNSGTAAVILSLATNVIATALIAYQAWRHWRVLRTHLVKGHGTQSALKMLALLVESGVVYSIFLALITAWEGVVISIASGRLSHPRAQSVLLALDYLLTGCLVPLIAMYPTLIIILVSLERSALERALTPVPRPGPRPLPLASNQMSETLVSGGKSPISVNSEQSTHDQLPSVAFMEKAHEGDGHVRDVTRSEDFMSFGETESQKASPV